MIDPAHGWVCIKLRTWARTHIPSRHAEAGQGQGQAAFEVSQQLQEEASWCGNVANGSKLIHPKHNKTVSKQQLRNYMYDPVAPELEVACHRVLNAMGSSANFKLQGKKGKAVFTFEVRDYDEARIFRERGVDQCVPAFRPKDRTDYETKEMVKIFGKNATPCWEDIWMPMDPTYTWRRDMRHGKRVRSNAILHYCRKMCVRAPQD
jgi:hypothetical protein